METTLTPQMITIAGLVLLLLVGLAARYFDHRRHTHGSHNRFGEDHSQAIAEMGERTRLEAQRKERERLAAGSPNQGR